MSKENRLTDEQAQVVEASVTSRCLMVNSLAGTGKSSTAMACVNENIRKSPDIRIGYLCFNNANAKEMKERSRLGSKFSVSTLHGLAYREYSNMFKQLNKPLISPKPWDIREVCEFQGRKRRSTTESAVNYARKLALDYLSAFCHSTALSIDEFFSLPMSRGIEQGIEELSLDKRHFRQEIKKLWELFSAKDNFPGTHDAYLKLFHLSLTEQKRFDLLIVDEAQDLFPVTEDIVRKISSNGGRLILFGDRYQQIYAWNNSINSMQHFEKEADILELTQSFRCPENVTREAEQYLRLLGFKKKFRAAPQAAEPGNCAIVSRTNSGVFINLAEMLNELEPKDIWIPGGHNISDFQMIQDCINWKCKKHEYIRFKALLPLQTDKEWRDYAAETRDTEMEVALKVVNSLTVKKTIKLLELVKTGEFARTPAEAEICLTTAHRSKGLQFGHVEIFEDFKPLQDVPATPEEKIKIAGDFMREMSPEARAYIDKLPRTPYLYDAEELRLAYVALTRSLGGLEPGILRIQGKTLDFLREQMANKMLTLLDKNIRGDWVLFE